MAGRTEKLAKDPGIYKLHARSCTGPPCKCPERFQATVFVAREGKVMKKHFDGIRAARDWRRDMGAAAAHGTVQTPTKVTVREAADRLLAGMRDGSTPTRAGERYRPATIRSYDTALEKYVLPRLGAWKLSDVHR